MAGYKETPRQKMIAMLYLVLTALLALNVSKEILHAFLVVNESIEVTNQSLEGSIAKTYSEFAKQNDLQPVKVKEWYDKAMEVKTLSDGLVEFIQTIKAEVIAKTDGITVEEARVIDTYDIKRKDNYDVPTVYFTTPEAEGGKDMARKLKERIEGYRAGLLGFIGEDKRGPLSETMGLTTEGPYYNRDKKPESWEKHHFYHTILTADITILNKIIAEVRNAEAKVVAVLFQEVTGEDFTFDKIQAAVIPKSNYILQGGQFEADVFLAALDTKNPLMVEIGGAEATGDSGVYKLVQSGSAVGERTVEGVIKMTNRTTGIESKYPFNISYVVAPPSATVSATKMNVFYRGLENPISVSVPGVANDKVVVRCEGGTLSRAGGGDFIVKPGEGSKAKIYVSATIDGDSRSMGVYEYRIKRVPAPTPKVSGVPRGSISKSRLQQHGVVTAELEDFLFDGVRFTVLSFNFTATVGDLLKKEQITGNQLNSASKSHLNRVRPGSKVYFEDIRAKGPDGKTYTLSPIILTVR